MIHTDLRLISESNVDKASSTVIAVAKKHGGNILGLRNVARLTRTARNYARTRKIRCYHADCRRKRRDLLGVRVTGSPVKWMFAYLSPEWCSGNARSR